MSSGIASSARTALVSTRSTFGTSSPQNSCRRSPCPNCSGTLATSLSCAPRSSSGARSELSKHLVDGIAAGRKPAGYLDELARARVAPEDVVRCMAEPAGVEARDDGGGTEAEYVSVTCKLSVRRLGLLSVA